VLVASLGAAWSAEGPAAGQGLRDEAEDLLYWASSQPVFLRLSLQVDGQSHRAAWNAAAGQLFDAFDRNGDGTIARREGLARLVSLLSIELLSDTRSSGHVDHTPRTLQRDAFPKFLKDRGFGPFHVNSATGGENPSRLTPDASEPRTVENDLLLLVLDENRGGDLSRDEILLSGRRTLDLDDDECLSARELLTGWLFAFDNASPLESAATRTSPGGSAPAPRLTNLASASPRVVARELAARYDDDRDGLLQLAELGLSPPDAARFDQDHNASLDVEETSQMLRRPVASVEIAGCWPARAPSPPAIVLGDQAVAVELSPGCPGFDRETILRLFAAIDIDRNQYLVPAEAEGRDFVQRAFRVMDRNGDELVVADEFVEYARLVSMLGSRQFVVTFAAQSQSIFEAIDDSRDGKLSRAELNDFGNRVAAWDTDGNGALTAAEVSRNARIRLGTVPSWPLQAGGASAPRQLLGQPLWFTRMDLNRDGFVSRREFLGPVQSFLVLDSGGDALLDPAEAAAAGRPTE
jgi:Ca2+-binding EF-hand superfamily protein